MGTNYCHTEINLLKSALRADMKRLMNMIVDDENKALRINVENGMREKIAILASAHRLANWLEEYHS